MLLLVILGLGLFLRFYNYGSPSLESADAPVTLAGGIIWFYPHTYYPGLVHWQPPVGHFLVGLGCMASGQDFSGASEIAPYFKPTLPALIGEGMVNAAPLCLMPIYIFGALFLIGSVILFVSVLGKRVSALYAASVVAFMPIILWYSRYTHVDIINWAIVVFGLLFAWLGYKSEKSDMKYFYVSMALFGLATATKFTSAIFLFFGLFLYVEKRFRVERMEISGKNLYKIFETIIILSIIFGVVFLFPFEFNTGNVDSVYKAHTTFYSKHTQFGPSLAFLPSFIEFLAYLNPFDIAILIYAVYFLYHFLRERGKPRNERFVLYSFLFFLFVMIFLGNASSDLYLAVPVYLGLIMLMALALDGTGNSISRRFGIAGKYMVVFIILHVVFNFATGFIVSPFYLANTNVALGGAAKPYAIYGENTLAIASYLDSVLGENETFFYPDVRHDVVYFYLQRDFLMAQYMFEQNFMEEFSRSPGIAERISLFEYGGKRIRYLILNRAREYGDSYADAVLDTCTPVKTIPVKADGVDEALIFDMNECMLASTVIPG